MNTHAEKSQDNKNNTAVNYNNQNKTKEITAFQFADNRPETVFQRKLIEMANNSMQATQLNSFYTNFNSIQQPFQKKENIQEVAQLGHKKGASRVAEAKKRKNANRRQQEVRRQEQQAQEAQEWSDTVSEWASWAWEKAKGVGLAVVKKTTGGIDPFEVAQNLKAVYNSNASIKKKVIVLALYGTYEVSNFLNENMATLIGGDVGAIMELENDLNTHIENLANLWENGAIDEGQVEEGLADQLIGAMGGGEE
jgi:hypothetical protein